MRSVCRVWQALACPAATEHSESIGCLERYAGELITASYRIEPHFAVRDTQREAAVIIAPRFVRRTDELESGNADVRVRDWRFALCVIDRAAHRARPLDDLIALLRARL